MSEIEAYKSVYGDLLYDVPHYKRRIMKTKLDAKNGDYKA